MKSSPPLHVALNEYRIRVSVHKKGYEQEKYRLASLAGSKLGAIPINEITSVHIATFRDERLATVNTRTQKPISSGTVRLELSLLSSVFDMSRKEWGFCSHNPVIDIKKPKPGAARDRRLTAREKQRIARYGEQLPNKEFGVIVTVALETAMRQGEILGLLWENVDLNECVATLPNTKNDTRRDVPLSIKARDAIVKMGPKVHGRVFTYTSPGIKSAWRLMTQLLKIEDLHFHDLRHEAVSVLFELGTLNMMEVSAISGHKSLSMLKRYTHLRAKTLVPKLEGKKGRKNSGPLNSLLPYPAQISVRENLFHFKLLDFRQLYAYGFTKSEATRNAQLLLLHSLVTLIRQNKEIPQPASYLYDIPEESIVMIDPVAPLPPDILN